MADNSLIPCNAPSAVMRARTVDGARIDAALQRRADTGGAGGLLGAHTFMPGWRGREKMMSVSSPTAKSSGMPKMTSSSG